jgi:RNA polymerase sigma factor (sigma-70 family)
MVRNRAAFERHLRILFDVGTAAGLTDAELLERFANRGNEESELAFAVLVERHGPMVHGVIRRVLNNPHDAQDAFQATFLVLLQRAHSIRKRGSLVSWLHGVALRVAWASRLLAARHRKHERRKAAASGFVDAGDLNGERNEDGPIIHEELSRLPERYRAPLILCYLEGLTHEQAAARLIWPVGTVKSRLSRGRDRLRDRLLRRGVAPSVAVMSALSFRNSVCPDLPSAVVEATVQAAWELAAGATNPRRVATTAAALAEEAMKSMFSAKLKTALLAAFTVVAAGGIVVAQKTGALEGGGHAAAAAARGGPILVLDAPQGVDQDTPTPDEIWDKFVQTRFSGRKVLIERIGEKTDACRVYPLAGACQLVHRHFKCTLYYDEHHGDGVDHRVDVVYIDKDHLQPCAETSHKHVSSANVDRAGGTTGSPYGIAVGDPAANAAAGGGSASAGTTVGGSGPGPGGSASAGSTVGGGPGPGGTAAARATRFGERLSPGSAPSGATRFGEGVTSGAPDSGVARFGERVSPGSAASAAIRIGERVSRGAPGSAGARIGEKVSPGSAVEGDDTPTLRLIEPRGKAGGRAAESDQERRLADVERKLDRVLRLLERSARPKE